MMAHSSTRPTLFSTHSTSILILILLTLLASFSTNVNVNALPTFVHPQSIPINDALIRRSPQIDGTVAVHHRNPHSPYMDRGTGGYETLHLDEDEDGNVREARNGDREIKKRSLSELFLRLYHDHLSSEWRRRRRWGSNRRAAYEIEEGYDEIDDDDYWDDEDFNQEDDDEQVLLGIQQTYEQEGSGADEAVEVEDDEGDDDDVSEGMMLIESIFPSQGLFGDDDEDDYYEDQMDDKNHGQTPKNENDDNDVYFGGSRRQALHSPQPKIVTTEPLVDWVVDEWDEDLDEIEAMDELLDWVEDSDHVKSSSSSTSKSKTCTPKEDRRNSNAMHDQGAATDDILGNVSGYTSPFQRLFTQPWLF